LLLLFLSGRVRPGFLSYVSIWMLYFTCQSNLNCFLPYRAPRKPRIYAINTGNFYLWLNYFDMLTNWTFHALLEQKMVTFSLARKASSFLLGIISWSFTVGTIGLGRVCQGHLRSPSTQSKDLGIVLLG
jgi:hypothetical protein